MTPAPGGCSPAASLQRKACLFSLFVKVVLMGEVWGWMNLGFTYTYHILCECVNMGGAGHVL